MLSYRHLPAKQLELQYIDGWDKGMYGHTRLYKVPIEEFDLIKVGLKQGEMESLALPGPHTFVVTKGTIKAKVGDEELVLKQSHIAFVQANAALELELVDGQEGEIWGSFFQEKSWA